MVSLFGSDISGMAIPMTALALLNANSAQMGLLQGAQGAAFFLLSLPIGVWADRLPRRPLLIVSDIARALLLGAIPLCVWSGRLSMGFLIAIGALTGAFTVCFQVAERAFLPSIVTREELVAANSNLSASEAIAEMSGPALAGTLVQWLTAPFAILLDSLSYLFSAACFWKIRVVEEMGEPVETEGRAALLEGVRFIRRNAILRSIALMMASLSFFGNFFASLYLLFLVRELHITPAVVGVLVGLGGLGKLFSASVNAKMTRRFGVGKVIFLGLVLGSWDGVVMYGLHGSVWFCTLVLGFMQLVGDVPTGWFYTNVMSLRQAVIPTRLQGRVHAGMDFLIEGLAPLGAVVGGFLGVWIGLRLTLLMAMCGPLLALLFFFASPIFSLRELPDNAEG